MYVIQWRPERHVHLNKHDVVTYLLRLTYLSVAYRCGGSTGFTPVSRLPCALCTSTSLGQTIREEMRSATIDCFLTRGVLWLVVF
jgi:hypothetical protein